jgi:alpha-L-rhamnosidase
MSFSDTRTWNAFWISFGEKLTDWRRKTFPAPYFRKEFKIQKDKPYKLYVSGLGYHEIYINESKVGDYELAPNPSNYDLHTGYLVYDITDYLIDGRNTIGAILGNGPYNCQTAEVWHFDKAVWRDYPKLLLEITDGENTVLVSDDTWKVTTSGPIKFDSFRNGEYYDARLELSGWNCNDFDDSSWRNAEIVPGPGGILFEQTAPPCRVSRLFLMCRLESGIWDAGQNIAGRAELVVQGKRGSFVKLQYGDVLNHDGSLNLDDIAQFINSGEFQTECYKLKGKGVEKWHSRFTYHGFRYVAVEISGEAEIVSLTAQAIHSDLKEIGGFTCSHPDMNALENCTRWSFLNNFVGIPTDCPHREKNGWTNDAQLASDTGLFHFELTEAYREWLGTLRDCQRPNGQLPGMAPTSGWGYNWGSGTLFDTALFGIPRSIYLYRGDSSVMRENYEAFKRNVEFSGSLAKDNILKFGLGDWQHYDISRAVAPELVTTGWYFYDLTIIAEASDLFGFSDDAKRYSEKAARVAESFNKCFYNGGGSYANDEKTALAVAVGFGLCTGENARLAVSLLERKVREDGYIADFGIVGAKFVPRVLAEYGFAESAFRIFTQEKFPGWCKWVRDGETTLLEDFAGNHSHCHIMFGDLSAWMMQYAAGLEPDFSRPGFCEVVLKPRSITSLNSMFAWYDSIYGRISVHWKRNLEGVTFTAQIPKGINGKLELPDKTELAFNETINTIWKG